MKRTILALLMIFALLLTGIASAEGAQPAVEEKAAAFSMGDYLHRYPDQEIVNSDGSVTEVFTGITLEEHDAFLAFLAAQTGKMGSRVFAADANFEYKDETGKERFEIDHYELEEQTPIHYVVIKFNKDQVAINFRYDTAAEEARITYPVGTYDERTRTAKAEYSNIVSMMEAGNVAEAVQAYRRIPDPLIYSPAVEYMAGHAELVSAVSKYRFEVPGEYVTFGHYEQDGDAADGLEEIEWLVLDVKDGVSLLVSRYALDTLPYNTDFTDITWENSSLRAWLNGDFMNAAFSDKEKSAILTAEVDNSPAQGNSEYEAVESNNTQDTVFLLSYAEAWQYFTKDASRICTPTAYAVSRGAWISPDDAKTCAWWLRSPGSNGSCAMRVSGDGTGRSAFVDYKDPAVRPVIRIDLNSDSF